MSLKYMKGFPGEKWSESVSHVWLYATPWTVAHQALLSLEFSRQEYWTELPCASPGDLLCPGIQPGSPVLQMDSLLFKIYEGLPSWYSGKESTCQCKRPKTWMSGKWQPTPIFLPGKSHREAWHVITKSWTWLSTHTWNIWASQVAQW